jgi:hypothetical protein
MQRRELALIGKDSEGNGPGDQFSGPQPGAREEILQPSKRNRGTA